MLKIGDFGISKIDIKEMSKQFTTTMGSHSSPAYIAPEVLKNKASTTKVDMWAIGIILYQLVSSSNLPFESENFFGLIEAIKENDPPPVQTSLSTFIKEAIKALLDKNPENRPDASTLLNKDEMKIHISKVISLFSSSTDRVGL